MTSNPDSNDVARYSDEVRRLGARLEVVNYNDMEIIDEAASRLDACIIRGRPLDAEVTAHAIAVLEQGGTITSASSDGWRLVRDRVAMARALEQRNVPTPRTWRQDISEIDLHMLPLVVKKNNSNQGKGVWLIRTLEDVHILRSSAGTVSDYSLQEYVKNDTVYDDRYFVVGDRVVAAMRRHAKDGEYRSNIAQGGRAEGIVVDGNKADIAVRAARAVGCLVAGVDIMDSVAGSVVIEVNTSPGLGIENAAHVNVAGEVVRYLGGLVHA